MNREIKECDNCGILSCGLPVYKYPCPFYMAKKEIKEEINMREIKFRAWWEKSKRMIDENFVKDLDEWSELCDKDRELADRFTGIALEIEIPVSQILGRFSNCPIMQFTGLKDKNGKKIFEGDIVRIKHPHKNREWQGEVIKKDYEWTGKGFCFPHFDIPTSLFSEGTEYIEVIGNIYE